MNSNYRDIANVLYEELIKTKEFEDYNSSFLLNSTIYMIAKYIDVSLIEDSSVNEEYLIVLMRFHLNEFLPNNDITNEFCETIIRKVFARLSQELLERTYLCIGSSVENISKIILLYAKKQETQLNCIQLNAILYYIQGYTLSKHNALLFNSPIKYWDTYGPVINKVIHEYNGFLYNPIPSIILNKPSFINADLNSCDFSYMRLNNITNNLPDDIIFTLHLLINKISSIKNEDLILKTKKDLDKINANMNETISYELLKKYFKTVDLEKNFNKYFFIK